MIYIVNFVILSVNSLFERFIKSRVFLIFSGIILIVFAGLRNIDFIGDSQQYAWDYAIYLNRIGKGQFEIGFSFLEKICSILGMSVTEFFLVIAFLSIFFLILGFKNLTLFPVSALLYYYSRFFINRDMNQIRAGLAASLVVFALYYLIKEKLIKFLGILLIAGLIHKAAFIAFLIYPINKIMENCVWNFKKKKRIFIYVMILIGVFFLSRVSSNFISNVIGNFDVTYVSRTSDYGKASYGLLNPVIWLQVMISLISLGMDEIKNNKKINICLSCYMISTILLILFSNFYVLAGRLSTILATVEPILILKIINNYLPNNYFYSRIISWIVFVGITLVIFWLINCYGTSFPVYKISV